MYRVTRTVYNVQLETAKMFNTPYAPMLGSTLNEKHGIIAPTSAVQYPHIQYYGLGLHYGELVEGKDFELDEVKHNPIDGDVFIPVPFIMRDANIGLTATENENYRMCKEISVNGKRYMACYLKKIDSIDSSGIIYKIGKGEADSEYSVDSLEESHMNILNPTIAKGLDLYPEELTYAGYSQKAVIQLTYNEAQDLKHSIDILYPTANPGNKYEIGELMLVSGTEVATNGKLEAGSAQAAFFAKISLLLNKLKTDIPNTVFEKLEVGGMLPLALRK